LADVIKYAKPLSLALFIPLIAACGSVGGTSGSMKTVTASPAPATVTVTATVTAGGAPTGEPTSTPTAAQAEAPDDPGDGHGMKMGTAFPFNNTSRLDSSETGQGTVTVIAVKDRDRCTDSYCSVESGKRLFSIQVKYTGTKGEVPYNPFNWSLVDSEGQQYNEGFFQDVAMGPKLNSGDLGAGRTVKGVVSYEVPKAAKIVSVDFSNIGDWKVE